ncbi:hypothetical protein ACAH01_00960 [Halomicrobium sp. HM KBTZ05]
MCEQTVGTVLEALEERRFGAGSSEGSGGRLALVVSCSMARTVAFG